jgi:hypothetical protein
MTQTSTDNKHSRDQDTVPSPERGPETIGERTRFLLNLMRRAYCKLPGGMLGVCDIEIVRLLLSAGADPAHKPVAGSTARSQAIKWKHEDIVKLLAGYA